MHYSCPNKMSLVTVLPWIRVVWIMASMAIHIDANADAKRLYDDVIMKSYNRNVRATRNYNDSTEVSFGIRLAQIVDVDEVNQIMTINLWVEQEWTDPRLVWSTREYNNISSLFVPAEKLWKPDIMLYNNADGDYSVTSGGKAFIQPNGKVSYNPPMQYKSFCEIDVKYFPFDEQLCEMKFGPWTHDMSKVDMFHNARKEPRDTEVRMHIENAISIQDYTPSVEWDLMNVTAEEHAVGYPCCKDSYYVDVTFYITIRRKHLYYVINLVVPCMSMNILTICVFYLPSYSGEKIGVMLSVFLSMGIFQLVLFDLMPSSSLRLPLIGKYIFVTTLLVTISAIVNTWILNMNHRMSSTHQMPRFVRWLFLDILSRLLYTRLDKSVSPLDENIFSYHTNHAELAGCSGQMSWQDIDKVCAACKERRMKASPNVTKGFDGLCFIANHYKDTDDSNWVVDEWRYVALIFDRVLLWIYLIITLVVTLEVYMNAPALYGDKQPLTKSNAT